MNCPICGISRNELDVRTLERKCKHTDEDLIKEIKQLTDEINIVVKQKDIQIARWKKAFEEQRISTIKMGANKELEIERLKDEINIVVKQKDIQIERLKAQIIKDKQEWGIEQGKLNESIFDKLNKIDRLKKAVKKYFPKDSGSLIHKILKGEDK